MALRSLVAFAHVRGHMAHIDMRVLFSREVNVVRASSERRIVGVLSVWTSLSMQTTAHEMGR